MKKFIVTYHAPSELLQQSQQLSPDEMEKGMEAWMIWAKNCGDKLVDLGNPSMNGQKVLPDGKSENSDRQVCNNGPKHLLSCFDIRGLTPLSSSVSPVGEDTDENTERRACGLWRHGTQSGQGPEQH